MKFKLDENLGELGADTLRQAGFEVATVPDERLCSSDDPTVLDACHRENRCLITMDLHFSNPFVYPPGAYAGIIVIRLPSPTNPDDLAAAISTAVDGLKESDVRGKLWVVRPGRIREYSPYH